MIFPVGVAPIFAIYEIAVPRVSARMPWLVIDAGELEARGVRIACEVQVELRVDACFFSQRPPELI